jgi:hypothetical protein
MGQDGKKGHEKHIFPTASAILDDGTLVELVYQPQQARTGLALYSAGRWTLQEYVDAGNGIRLVPFSPKNNLIKNEAVLLPSEPRLYGSEDELIASISGFIRRYADLTPSFEKVATHYVILSWLYDAFNELPYLRLRGDYGTGKTRTLLTIGSICYKPFFASGASTVSPIFHTLDAFRGTLIIDEADFRFSDASAEIVKVLNNGNVRGMPVLRTMLNRQREFNPQAFHVFGPKIVATRGSYQDTGLESRFITEEMGGRPLRADIPINLPPSFKDESRELRNKLLLFRFRNRHSAKLNEKLVDRRLEPRLSQIFTPLLSVVASPSVRDELCAIAANTQTELVAAQGMSPEAQVLECIVGFLGDTSRSTISVANIAEAMRQRFANEYDRAITNRWVGGILRRRLNIRPYKSHGIYVVFVSERSRIETLCKRFGVDMQ